MALEIEKGTLLALHVGRMKDEETVRPEHISAGKLNNVREAIEIAREARTILGGKRHHARLLAAAAREQPGERPHLRGHERGAYPDPGPGLDRYPGLSLDCV
jgi:alkylation response protein AidB-like acyl-CoA dehydrogenase